MYAWKIRSAGMITWVLLAATAAGLEAQDRASYAALFAYQVDRGAEGEFATGYRTHLAWHRAKGDTLGWYGWFVLTGEGAGTFVDGIFGVGLRALDERVDPAGDLADAAANVNPYARPVYRKLLRRVPASSATAILEERHPSRFLEVFHIATTAAGAERLERLVQGDAGPRALYAVMNGGALCEYLLLVPRGSFAEFEEGRVRDLLHGIGDGTTVSTAAWLFRPDLSLLSLDAR